MSEFEQGVVFGGNDERRTDSTRDDTGGNRGMKYITETEIQEATAALVAKAAEIFAQSGNCPTYAIVIAPCGERSCLMPASMRDVQDKDCFIEAIAQAAMECGAVAVIVVSESWISDIISDETTPPSQPLNNWEALCATVETADGTSMHLWPILRNGDSARLGKRVVECCDNSAGRLTGLLRRPRPDLN